MNSQARCPVCNRRLFDIGFLVGHIHIKCPQCNRFAHFEFVPDAVKIKAIVEPKMPN